MPSDHFIDGWDAFYRNQMEQSRAAFEARPDYQELMAEASLRGLRRITLNEQCNPGTVDAYLWRGGVWVKEAA